MCIRDRQYFESRGGKFKDICFFGLQYFVKRYLSGVVVTQEKIDEAAELIESHMGPGHFNRVCAPLAVSLSFVSEPIFLRTYL